MPRRPHRRLGTPRAALAMSKNSQPLGNTSPTGNFNRALRTHSVAPQGRVPHLGLGDGGKLDPRGVDFRVPARTYGAAPGERDLVGPPGQDGNAESVTGPDAGLAVSA